MKSLTEDPSRLAELLDQFLGPNLYSWGEMMSILSILFTGEEMRMIRRRAAIQEWEGAHPPGPGVIPAEQGCPLADPGWSGDSAQHRGHVGDLGSGWGSAWGWVPGTRYPKGS